MVKFSSLLVLAAVSTVCPVASAFVAPRQARVPSSVPVSTSLYQSSNAEVTVLDRIKSSLSIGDTSADATSLLDLQKEQRVAVEVSASDETASLQDEEYKKGIAIIGFITLLNASLAPVWHVVFATESGGPPPLFLNAVVSVVAFIGLLAGGTFLDGQVETTSALAGAEEDAQPWQWKSFRGGMELGLWKGLGTTCHIYGMALTTANHGAFLLQLTTLIVPVLQGLRGAEQIPRQIQLAVVMALAGIVAFTQDPTGASETLDTMQMGDTLVLGAAFFYSLYDIQTFYWGREVPRTELVTIKIGFQAVLSILLCAVAVSDEVMAYLQNGPDYALVVPVVLWSGLIVNALATFLQVGGIQSVGPTRAQTIFASQPLWAGILNFVFLGEIMGPQGFLGGGAFLGALFLAATAKAPVTPATEQE